MAASSYHQYCESSTELEDGRIFKMTWVNRIWPATFHDPEEVDSSEPEYWLDNELGHLEQVDESDLPPECDQEFLNRLQENGHEVTAPLFGDD